MIIAKTVAELRNAIQRYPFRSLGFVPTMGALHQGHISLVNAALENNDLTVVSIFINPKQFGPNEDFDKYPRDWEQDIAILEAAGAHILFLPEVQSIYQPDEDIEIRLPKISGILCGKHRPGHFEGVALVLTKLFNIVAPNKAYFGQKDFQQTILVKKLTAQLFWNIEIIICPTVREEDGLAMSSRNRYLSSEDRKFALALYTALRDVKEKARTSKDAERLAQEARDFLRRAPRVELEYFEILNANDLSPVDYLRGQEVALGAIRVNGTRLIDNILLTY